MDYDASFEEHLKRATRLTRVLNAASEYVEIPSSEAWYELCRAVADRKAKDLVCGLAWGGPHEER